MKRWIQVTLDGRAKWLPVYGIPASGVLGSKGHEQLRNTVWNKLTALPPIEVPGGWWVGYLDPKVLELMDAELSTEL